MWYQLFRFFSRKELAKLQFGNRFFDKTIRESKLPALHFIDCLLIRTINHPNMKIVCLIVKGEIIADNLIPGEQFCPPSYVRFSNVFLKTLIIDGYFMERLMEHKIVFNNCVFSFDALDVQESLMQDVFTGFRRWLSFLNYILRANAEYPPTILSPNETMTTLMEDVFTECSEVALRTKEWTSVKQLKLCTLSGVYTCDKLFLDGDKMVLSIDDPLFESMFEWLYSSRGNAMKELELKGIAGCEALVRKLTTEFVDDIEYQTYELSVYDLQEDFLNEFDDFSAENTTTGESMQSYAGFNDDGDAGLFLKRFLPV